MLESAGRNTSHAGQATVTITSSHAKAKVVQAAVRELTLFFKELARTAEQLGIAEKVTLIAKKALQKNTARFEATICTKFVAGNRMKTVNCRF